MRTIFALLLAGCAVSAAAQSTPPLPLFGRDGVRLEDVRQGTLGSCYFHSVIGALAQSDAKLLHDMISSNPDGTLTVTFADQHLEHIYPADLQFLRETGYEMSAAQWVGALFRAYAQRVLRGTLIQQVDKTDWFAPVKAYTKDLLATNDTLLLAWDRTIRTQVAQDGEINQVRLRSRLKQELSSTGLPESMRDRLLDMVATQGVFDSLSEMVKTNGELFGAYRAVSQGGLPQKVMQSLKGSSHAFRTHGEADPTAQLLADAAQRHLAVAACTSSSAYYRLSAAAKPIPEEDQPWYVHNHCYTVVDYDAAGRSVKLRNPWANHPNPDGVFTLPLERFVAAFGDIVTP